MHPRLKTALVLLTLLVASCAHLSVVHLDKKPWTLGQQETLAMRYWEFTYSSRLEDNRLIVTGTAKPVAGAVPEWATWIQDLWMQIYLSDDNSRVLAKDLRLALSLASDSGFEPVLARDAASIFDEVGARYGACDDAEVVRWYDERAGTRVVTRLA